MALAIPRSVGSLVLGGGCEGAATTRLGHVHHLVDVAALRVVRTQNIVVRLGSSTVLGVQSTVHRRLVPSVVSVVTLVIRVTVAAALALTTKIVNTDLARLKAVKERLQVRNANSEDGKHLYKLDNDCGLPHGK